MFSAGRGVRRPIKTRHFLALAIAVAALGYWATTHAHKTVANKSSAVVPVTTSIALKRDFPIYLSGIGSVQAFNTVTVRVRVDGEIQKIGFTEGQDVAVGDLLAQIDPRPFQAQLAQAEAQKARDEAQLANAKRDFGRSNRLVGQGYATQQTVDTQNSSVAALEAAIKGDQAQIDFAKVQLDYTRIVAPIAGRTGIRLVDQGNVVHAADSTGLVMITQVEPISVIFTLPEDSYDAVAEGIKAAGKPLSVSAFSRDNAAKPRAEGALLLMNNQIDRATATLQMKATFPNTDHALWPGLFVNTRLLLSTQTGIVVPFSAVQRGPEGLYAYVVKDDVAKIQPITVAKTQDALALIATGLSEGDRVVTDGQYKLRAGSHVIEQAAAKTAAAQP